MHGAILGARPPLLYWLPGTVAVIHACASLRAAGTGAWETIDAGPQVKVLCLERDARAVVSAIATADTTIRTIVCAAGPGLQYEPVQG